MAKKRVVIIGGGFGGLTAAKSLSSADLEVTLVDRTNHHLFQPLLYQVAMAGLSPAEIAAPIRSILAQQENARVLFAEVKSVDLAAKAIVLGGDEVHAEERLPYDWLIMAAGAKTAYFGHDEWAKFAPGLKSLEDAVEIRRRVLLAFEAAERETDEQARKRLLTFVVIGGGPTGVELAGAIAELSKNALAKDFRAISPALARVILAEGGDRILATFAPSLSEKAKSQLAELGVELRLGTRVTAIDEKGATFGDERVEAATVVWAAGVAATSLGATLGVPIDRAGRVVVESDCSIPGYREAFAIGDMAAYQAGDHILPGVSPVAMQQARYVAKIVRGKNPERTPFHYVDKGSMATIGRSRAITELGKLRLSGLIAWLAWLFVHIWYLIGFRNRVIVIFTWAWSYWSYRRGARLITGRRT